MCLIETHSTVCRYDKSVKSPSKKTKEDHISQHFEWRAKDIFYVPAAEQRWIFQLLCVEKTKGWSRGHPRLNPSLKISFLPQFITKIRLWTGARRCSVPMRPGGVQQCSNQEPDSPLHLRGERSSCNSSLPLPPSWTQWNN